MAGSNSTTLYCGTSRNRREQVTATSGTSVTTISVGGLLEKVTRGSVADCLQNALMPVEEISRRIGLAETSSRRKVFTRCTGKPPSVYRRARSAI